MHALMKPFRVLGIGIRVGRNLDHECNRDASQLMTMQHAAVAQEDISPVSTQTTTANTWSPVMFLRFSRVTVVTHERIVQSHAVDDPTRALMYTSECQPPVSRSASFCYVRVSSHGFQLSRRATPAASHLTALEEPKAAMDCCRDLRKISENCLDIQQDSIACLAVLFTLGAADTSTTRRRPVAHVVSCTDHWCAQLVET